MTTLFFVLVFLALVVMVGRAIRRREIAKLRETDASFLGELKRDSGLLEDAPPEAQVQLPRDAAGVSNIGSTADGGLVAKTAQQPTPSFEPPPSLKQILFSDKQRTTLQALETILEPRYRVYPNLALSELMRTTSSTRLSFAICDKEYWSLEVAFEFRDQLSEETQSWFESLRKPLVLLDGKETADDLRKLLAKVRPGLVTNAAVGVRCPKCYGAMKLRQPDTGKHAGKRFWLCHQYPRCRGNQPA